MSAELIRQWFSQEKSQPAEDYEHLLLRQTDRRDWEKHIDELKKYFEAAHLDARQCFHENAGISLHPLNRDAEQKVFCYPNDLDEVAQAGLFGEVMNAMMIGSASIIGEGTWQVPVYLFNQHQDAENYIHELNHGIQRRKRSLGRFGNDCIGISLDSNLEVIGIITGESKFRKSLSPGKVEKLNGTVHKKFCEESIVPVNILKFSKLLEKKDATFYARTIASLEALNRRERTVIERQHIYSLIVCKVKTEYPPTYISQTSKHENYTVQRPLQCVEIIIPDGKDLVAELYGSLYSEAGSLTNA